jgi:hypothetical protein
MIERAAVPSAPSSSEAQIKHLEEVNRWILDSLEMVTSLGDFQSSDDHGRDSAKILKAVCSQLNRLMPFSTTAFLLDDTDLDFVLTDCHPASDRWRTKEQVLSDANVRIQWVLLSLQTQSSRLSDANLVESISKFDLATQAVNTTLNAQSKGQQLSLIDFLR